MSKTTYTTSSSGGVDTFEADYRHDTRVVHGSHEMGGLKRLLSGEDAPDTTIYTLIQTAASKNVDTLLKGSGLESRGYFGTGLLNALHRRLSDILGGNYYSFPMVNMGHSLDQNPFYPHTHILRGLNIREEEFKTAVRKLLSSKSIDIMVEREKPQNYQTGPLEFLRANALNSSPLVIDPRVSTFTGTQMIAIANQLLPYSVKRETFSDNSD